MKHIFIQHTRSHDGKLTKPVHIVLPRGGYAFPDSPECKAEGIPVLDAYPELDKGEPLTARELIGLANNIAKVFAVAGVVVLMGLNLIAWWH